MFCIQFVIQDEKFGEGFFAKDYVGVSALGTYIDVE